MDGRVLIIVVVAFALAVIVVASLWGLRARKRRARQLTVLAAELGYQYAEKDASLPELLGGLALFSQGIPASRQAVNVLRGGSDGGTISLFDYSYIVVQGRRTDYRRQSVLLFESERLSLPQFALRPEGLGQKLRGAMGQQDIDFAEQRAFSGAYMLQGPDEARIRAFFDAAKLDYIAQRRGLSIEAKGNQLIYYRDGKVVPAKSIAAFVEEGKAIMRLMAGA